MESIIEAFSEPIHDVLSKLPIVFMTLMCGYIVLVIVRRISKSALKMVKIPKALNQILCSIVNFLLWVGLISLILQSLGLNQIALAVSGSVAIIGLAVATGANALIADILSGLFLAKDPDFNVGYKIKMNDTEGVVEKIDIRKIRIRDNNGRLMVIPNSMLDKAQWIVLDENKK